MPEKARYGGKNTLSGTIGSGERSEVHHEEYVDEELLSGGGSTSSQEERNQREEKEKSPGAPGGRAASATATAASGSRRGVFVVVLVGADVHSGSPGPCGSALIRRRNDHVARNPRAHEESGVDCGAFLIQSACLRRPSVVMQGSEQRIHRKVLLPVESSLDNAVRNSDGASLRADFRAVSPENRVGDDRAALEVEHPAACGRPVSCEGRVDDDGAASVVEQRAAVG